MYSCEAWGPGSGLSRELAAIEQVFADGSRPVRLSALCWMAAVVSTIPPGEVQEQAEDRLAALIGCAGLSEPALLSVRAFRQHGLLAEPWPSTPAPRRGA